MAISVVATGTSVYTSSRSPAVTFASYTPATNDVVAWLVPHATITNALITLPAGWGNLHPSGGTSTQAHDQDAAAAVYHQVTAGESGGSATFTATNLWNTASTGVVVGIVLRGVDTTTPVDSSSTVADAGNSATPHTFAALAGVDLSTNSMVVGLITNDSTRSWTTPGGWTQRIYTANTPAAGIYTRDTLTTAGVDVTATNITPNVGDEYLSFTVAFSEAVAASPPVLKTYDYSTAVYRSASF